LHVYQQSTLARLARLAMQAEAQTLL
jgi:hypothetical protein